MATDDLAYTRGPIDDGNWPETLTAHVVEPGPEPRIEGYLAESDLAAHYQFSEIVFLLATGELPDPIRAQAFDLALRFLIPSTVSEASVHATCLARLCGATSTGTLGVAAVALGEQARFLIAEHAALFDWFEADSEPLPFEFVSANAPEQVSVARLGQAAKEIGVSVPILGQNPTRHAALLGLLHALGLGRPDQIELVFTLAKLPVAIAEARAVKPGALRDYPMNTPRFRYEVSQ